MFPKILNIFGNAFPSLPLLTKVRYSHDIYKITWREILLYMFRVVWSNYHGFFLALRPNAGMASSFLRFLDHTQRRTTGGRTPLDEWSVRRRDLYLTTHNSHNRQISMPPVGFEPTISAGKRPQIYALDRAATGTGSYYVYHYNDNHLDSHWYINRRRPRFCVTHKPRHTVGGSQNAQGNVGINIQSCIPLHHWIVMSAASLYWLANVSQLHNDSTLAWTLPAFNEAVPDLSSPITPQNICTAIGGWYFVQQLSCHVDP